MLDKVVRACALVAALAILAEPGVARDAPHQGSWPIYNGFNHQPTQDELRGLRQQDVTPSQAHEVDRLAESTRGIAPRVPHRTGHDTLASSGSCHSVKAAAFHRNQRAPPVSC